MADRDGSSGFDDTVALRDAHAAVDFALGHVFAERYRIDERLGAGGMGVVYRVHDLRLDEPVALKIMALGSAEATQRFVEEVRLARRVTHPHVARTHDIGEHQGLVYLTMECIAGETLETRIDREGALAPEVAAGFGVQLASALEAAHEAGVIHRDLKPSNVLVTEEGRAVVTDFGIARAARRDGPKRTAGMLGTPAYMSPEQAMGAALDSRSDLYSLGIILYEMLTARLPFEEEEPIAIALARLRRAPTHLSEHQPVPQPLSELTMWMLAREPDARPQSAKVVRESLQAFLSGTTGPASRTATASVSPGNRAIAVLPFRYRGDPEHDYLGEGLAEELIDTLSRTRGLKVLALGATARFSDNRDPMQVSSALDADAVVDGSVQFAAGRLRIVARLHDGRRGVQLWNDRFDIAVEDLFAVQESIGKRLAEALRLELHVHVDEASLPSEAVALYMRARRIYRQGTMGGSEEMLEMLEQCFELAPDFAPAYAAHAMGAVRGWWLENTDEAGARRERAEQSLARAVERAGDEPETHLARASFALNLGDYRVAARALMRALEIAPTMAEAHQHLGNLEVEAGRLRQGLARLRLSLELDPKLNASHMTLARLGAYQGKFEEAAERLQTFADSVGEHHPGLLVTRARIAMLQRDMAAFAPLVDTIEHIRGPLAGFARFFRLALGEIDIAEAEAIRTRANAAFRNPRFLMAMTQVCIEVYACAREYDAALHALGELAGGILVDVVWLDICPLFEPLRNSPAYAEAAAKVRHRAAAIWLP